MSPLTRGDTGPAASTIVTEQGQAWLLSQWRQDAAHSSTSGDGAILCPMPGRIIPVDVAPGANALKGQKLITLEAMKKEHSFTAPFDRTVAEFNADVGAQAQVEALLVRIEATDA